MSESPVQPTQVPPTEDPFQGLFRGLQNLVQSVVKVTEAGANKVRQGVFPQGTGIHGIYGFTIKADLAKPCLTIEVGQMTDRDAIAPRIEQIDEPDTLRLVAEMPGVGGDDVKIAIEGTSLHLSAEKASRRYRRDVPLPFVPGEGAMSYTCSDGIVEIRIRKPGGN